jgi:hypothetical protein
MFDLFNRGGTFLRKKSRYYIKPRASNDDSFLENTVETAINEQGVYETKNNIGLSILDCNHLVRNYQEVGCVCPICNRLNCLRCSRICERCLTTVGNCCTKILEGRLLCIRCYRILMAKMAALYTGRLTGKFLLIPFKGRE